MRLLPLAFVVLLSCASIAEAAAPAPSAPSRTGTRAFSRSTVLPKWAEPLEQIPPTASEEPVVFRLAEAQYWTGPNPAYLVNRAVQVNSSSRLSELGQFSISFIPAYQKLVVHRIALLRGGQVLDRTQSANVRVLDSESDAEKGFYYGASTAQVLLEDVKPGDALWMTYSVEGSNPVLGAAWTEHLPWTKDQAIELRKVVVLSPSAKPLRWRISGAARPSLDEPLREQRNGVSKLIFRESAVPADEYEAALPPDLIPVAVLDMSEYRDWRQVAQWATTLFPNKASQPEVQALARKFSSGTAEERASQALHWVQDEIRYFSVSMGENSHRPQNPEVVLKRRFGDCKDKSQLLVALYRAMGLQADPVLLNATSPKMPSQLLPSPTSFNHAIVRIFLDGKPYFVDPTLQSERGRISALPVPVPAASVLIVNADSAELINLPDEVLDEALVERSERMSVATLHGDAQLDLKLTYRGRFAAGMRQQYRALSAFELKKALLEKYERTYPGVQLVGAAKLSDGADGAHFVVDAQFTIPKVLKEENGIFHVPVRSHVMEGSLGIPDKLVRKYPLWLAAGHYRARYSLDLSLPGEARLAKEDDTLAVTTPNFDARAQLTWRGAHLNYYVDYAINKPEVAPADVPGLAVQVRKLDPIFESKLQFKPVAVSPQAAQDASLRVLDIMVKMSDHEDLQIETLRTGKTPELKFDESAYAKLNYRAMCESVVESASIRKWNPLLGPSMRALFNIVDARADKRTKDLCAVRMNFSQHDLPQASKDLAALVPDDTDPLTLMQAWADFHAHAPQQARNNLARFLKARSAASTLNTQDAMLALALSRRLGIEQPEEVRTKAATLRQDAWPMPLFALLRGTLTAEQLLAAIEALPPAAREHAFAEAHFVISQAYLAAGQPRKADLHLNWLVRYSQLGSAFEWLADADKYGATRADPDMREAWKHEGERGSENLIVRHTKAAADKGIAVAQLALGDRYTKGRGTRQEVEVGLALMEAAAAQGNSDAMNDLGVLYANGTYVPKDASRALQYYRQAAENGNAFAAYNLGHSYLFGDNGVGIDVDLPFRYMRDAAELEEKDAQFFLSRLYFEGVGTEKNDTLARFWAGQAQLRNSLNGAAMLGLVLLHTETEKEMRQIGLKLLASMANRNNAFAQFEYGRLLLDGTGMKADPEAAFELLKRSSGTGYERSTALLGRLYVEGLGVRADAAKGLALLADMEKKGVPDAYFQLGQVYRSDKSGLTDKARAADYFRRGAALGQREAAEALGVMLHTGDGIAQNPAEAARYYALAVKAGRPRALNNLASMYEKGEGVVQDQEKAMQLYRRAAQQGHTSAMMNLAELYETNGKEKGNMFLSLAYYMLASKCGLQDADDGLNRLKAGADQATREKAQSFAAAWKPGKAMPEEA